MQPPLNVSSHSMQQILVLYCLSKNISIAVMTILTNSSLRANTQRLNAYYAILKCYELHIGSFICYSVSLTLHTAQPQQFQEGECWTQISQRT